jgi:HEAT repeat protein
MTRLLRVPAWCVVTASLAVPCAAQQAAFEDVVRDLRNPDAKARMSAVRMLHESQHVEAAVPVASVVNDPLDEIQLEAIAAEMSFFLVQDVPARRRVGLVVEVRSKGQAPQAFDQGPLATWPRPAPPELVDALLTAVDDENPRVRLEAVYALGVVAEPPLAADAAGRLIKALDHYDPAIRAAAARVIGRLRVTRAGDTLIKSINDSNTAVRYASMRALGEIRDERAVQALSEQLKYYGKGEGAWSALDALARIGHASSAPLFTSRLADKDPYMRRAAAEGLARLGDASESSAIQSAASTEQSPMVRAAMTFALVKFGQNYLARLVDFFGSDRTSRQVQEYLLEIGPSVVPALMASLKEPDTGVRGGVAEVIGALGSPDARALLEPLTKDRDRGVAETAVAAIERIKMRQ